MTKQRLSKWLTGLALACVALWFVPLVRVSSLDEDRGVSSSTAFDAKVVAERLWNDTLLPSLDAANEASLVLKTLQADPEAAREQFGRTVGVSRGFMIYVRGSGTIDSMEGSKILVQLQEGPKPEIELGVGPIFGSAVRDAPGLISTNDVANSQEFNAVSTELNRLVEQRVLPDLKASAAAGMPIKFVACGEVKDPLRFKLPLKLVPVSVELE